MRKFWLRKKTELVNSRAWNWAQVLCLHTVLLTQTSLCLSRSPSQTLQDQTGHVTCWYGKEHPSDEVPLKWLTPIHPRGAMLFYQEGALAGRILEHHRWDCPQGAHTSSVLHPKPMQMQLVSITPYHSEPISTSSAALALSLFLGHADCHPTLQPTLWLPPDPLMTGPLLSFRSRLKYHLRREDFSDNPPPQSEVALSSQISPFILTLIYIEFPLLNLIHLGLCFCCCYHNFLRTEAPSRHYPQCLEKSLIFSSCSVSNC